MGAQGMRGSSSDSCQCQLSQHHQCYSLRDQEEGRRCGRWLEGTLARPLPLGCRFPSREWGSRCRG